MLEVELNLRCPKCKQETTAKLDPEEMLMCPCGSPLCCIGFQVIQY